MHPVDGAQPDPQLTLTELRPVHGVRRVVVAGDIDVSGVDAWNAALLRPPAPDTSAVLLDLTRVSFIGACGAHLLATLQENLNASAIPLELVVDTFVVERLLHLCGLRKLLCVHTTPQAALAHLSVALP